MNIKAVKTSADRPKNEETSPSRQDLVILLRFCSFWPIKRQMNPNSWFEHFKEQLQGLTEAYQSSGSTLSLLGYALKEKRLSSEEYLKWAVNHHQLPKLQSRFFTETPLSQEMFAKWATHYRWSAECLPVAEWDGSLIVVCLQPPQDFPSFPTAVLVLTELENIEAAWAYFHPVTRSESAPSRSPTPAPEGIDFAALTSGAKKSSDSFSFEDLGVASEESNSSEATNSGVQTNEAALDESGPSEAIAGIFDGPTVVRLETVGTSPLVSKDAAGPGETTVASSEPITPPPSSTEKTVVLEKHIPDNTLSGVTGLSKIVPPAPPATKVPPPPVPTEIFEESFANKKIPVVARPSGVAKPTVNPVASGHFLLEKLKKKNSSVFNERVKQILSEMKVYFEKSMILTLDDQESQMVAFAWDENFQGIKDANMRFPLKTPSIFNIVVSTQKSYHGYVSLNEINERFFDDWNQGKVPDHITVSPLMMGEKIVGLLVGFADKTAYNKTSLNLAEKLSVDFVKDMQAA